MANNAVVNMAEKCYLWSMDFKELYQSPIYKSWSNMKTRCTNPKYNQYHRYGGRNISYCKKWETFKGFYEDMGESYIKGSQLDRIDNDANYSKENCKWSTPIEQANNRHTNKFITYQGKTQTIEQWVRELGLKSSTVRQRYYVYKMPIEKCFSLGKISKSKNV
jgi:hypothetical protein